MKIDNRLLEWIGARLTKEVLGSFVVQKVEVWHCNDKTCMRIDFPTRNMYPPGANSAQWWIDDCVLETLDDNAAERLLWSVLCGMRQILEYHCVRAVTQGVLNVIPIPEPEAKGQSD